MHEHRNASDGSARRPSVSPARSLPRRLLSVWAHPGDEAEWSAGLLGRTARAGGHVTVVALTDGEHAFPADDHESPRGRRPCRRTELYAAMRRIGVHDVRFLGVPVGGVAASPRAVVRALTHLIEDICPDLVLTLDPDAPDRHRDQIGAAELVTRSWLERRSGDLWFVTDSDPAIDDVRMTLDEAELARKLDAIAAHQGRSSGPGRVGGERYRRWSPVGADGVWRADDARRGAATPVPRVTTAVA
jgi:LmbE family N-acetylglucosaminyl deacetylase